MTCDVSGNACLHDVALCLTLQYCSYTCCTWYFALQETQKFAALCQALCNTAAKNRQTGTKQNCGWQPQPTSAWLEHPLSCVCLPCRQDSFHWPWQLGHCPALLLEGTGSPAHIPSWYLREGRGGEGRGGEGNYWQGQSQNVKGTFSTACRDQAMPFEQTGDRLALVALGVDQVLFQTLFAHTNELWQR